MANDRATLLAKLRWRCRRGTQELDILLMHWLEQVASSATPKEIAHFERLLACEDSELQCWFFTYESCPDAELSRLVETIRTLSHA